MNDQHEFDTLLRSWLDESAPAHEPARLLDTILATTAGLRPRRRWVARLAGAGTLKHTTREPDRFSPIALASAMLLVAVLVAVIVGSLTAPVGGPPASTPPPVKDASDAVRDVRPECHRSLHHSAAHQRTGADTGGAGHVPDARPR